MGRKSKKQRSSELYDVLGLERGASPEDLKRAYKQMALKHHPVRDAQRCLLPRTPPTRLPWNRA